MNDLNRLFAPATAKITVEIDPASYSAYIRFKHAKIHKTLSDNRHGAILAIDVDVHGGIVGIELVGIQHLSISQIRRALPAPLREMDFENAQWIPTGSCRTNLVPA